MRHNTNHDHGRSHAPQLRRIRFEFVHPTARSVEVAGSFNDWQCDTKAMIPLGNGRWLEETALAPGTYEYCLVVDGHWMTDPLAKESVPNPFGGRNSVLRVLASSETAHLADAENLPLKNANQ